MGAVGEQLLCAYTLVTSGGEVEPFRPSVDDDHVDIGVRPRAGFGALWIQVKTSMKPDRKRRIFARAAFPAGAVYEDPAFVYAILLVEATSIVRCWLVPSAEFNRGAWRGPLGSRRVQLVMTAYLDRPDAWSGFLVPPLEVGARLRELLVGSGPTPSAASPALIGRVALWP
ncbi:MAG: hypothetical protein M3024_15185 [Candidatus Dormibacteraeota bacterium]|nr:hypothetical protein [Candidatus Dormibacteraeota bacterium]